MPQSEGTELASSCNVSKSVSPFPLLPASDTSAIHTESLEQRHLLTKIIENQWLSLKEKQKSLNILFLTEYLRKTQDVNYLGITSSL